MTLTMPNVPRTVWTHLAAILLAVAVTHYAPHIVHPEKHTGPLTLRLVDQHEQKQYWTRQVGASNDIIIMEWDGTMPQFSLGVVVKDITYTDDNKDVRHFVKATF